jgi:hypothetical protein
VTSAFAYCLIFQILYSRSLVGEVALTYPTVAVTHMSFTLLPAIVQGGQVVYVV